MVFPVQPRPDELDERGLFLVQEPDLRSRILPLFSFDPRDNDDRLQGHGTVFRVDPWSRCMTAYHVVEDLLEPSADGTRPVLRPSPRLAALELSGLAYGAVQIPRDAWRPIAGCCTIAAIEAPPFRPPLLRNVTELVALRIRSQNGNDTPYFPVDLRIWKPRIGDHVLALGFADLDVGQDQNPSISQHLYGSFCEITAIELADGDRGRPWPMFRVAAEWPGGMSGGPVFNEAGHVVGLISTGIGGSGIGTAAFFSGWDMPERIFGSLDPCNPGYFRCYGIFDHVGSLVFAGQDEAQVRRFARKRGLTDIGIVSIKPGCGDYVRLRSE